MAYASRGRVTVKRRRKQGGLQLREGREVVPSNESLQNSLFIFFQSMLGLNAKC